jgi:hypothetical protein
MCIARIYEDQSGRTRFTQLVERRCKIYAYRIIGPRDMLGAVEKGLVMKAQLGDKHRILCHSVNDSVFIIDAP